MEDTGSGLPVRQLLKMLASEDIDLATFKQLTKHMVGCDEEVPIDMTEDDPPAAETEAPARETSSHKNGARKNDVTPRTMNKRIKEHPGQGLKLVGGQIFCASCNCNVGSSKQDCDKHCNKTQKHKDDDDELCLQLQFNSRTRVP